MQLRDYQIEDFAAVLAAWEQHQVVLGRAATGLGKAVLLAAIANNRKALGRVMVLVDVKKLVRQLADTIKWVTGLAPGVEMGDERAINDDRFCAVDDIVCSTVQTQYSGPEGRERYRNFVPSSFSTLLLDETELFLAPKARSVVEWYRQNPNLKVLGLSATPLRSDGIAMANLFEKVAFDRDINWGIHNGWLVKARQAFVHVSVDFSTLKVNKNEDGDSDYSDEEIASRISNEQTQIELAKGIVHVAEDRKSIIVCPTVEVAKQVAHYISAEKQNSSRVIYGEMSDEEKDETFASFARNEFQFLSSVSMLTKGYDDPDIRAVFNCRKTKSKRLYTQIVGRGVRPLRGLLDGLATIEERHNAIANSAKNEALMVNMVGVDSGVRDCTLLDILGEANDEVMDRAKELVEKENVDPEDAIAIATEQIESDQDAERMVAEAEQERIDFESEAMLRRRIQVDARIDVEYHDDLAVHSQSPDLGSNGLSERQIAMLRKSKVPEATIARMPPEQAKKLAGELARRWSQGLCSFAQATVLRNAGYHKDQLKRMTRNEASSEIESLMRRRRAA